MVETGLALAFKLMGQHQFENSAPRCVARVAAAAPHPSRDDQMAFNVATTTSQFGSFSIALTSSV